MQKVKHSYNFKDKKEDPREIVKWCRRNFGDRGAGWDFYLTRGCVNIEIWEHKYEVMWKLWKE
jgi:hypothetical protein